MTIRTGETPAHELTPWATVSDGRDWLDDRLDVGATCPVCTQYARRYYRSLNSGMAYALLVFYKRKGREWGFKPEVLRGVGASARDESLLRHWGLFEQEADVDPENGRKGWWRVTAFGERFVNHQHQVPKTVVLFNNQVVGFQGRDIGIKEALANRFSLSELLASGSL